MLICLIIGIYNIVKYVALGKQIVKDRCPNCGGAIVGAADKDYICRYCGSKIMDVIVKK